MGLNLLEDVLFHACLPLYGGSPHLAGQKSLNILYGCHGT
jgi:hypothetical protein